MNLFGRCSFDDLWIVLTNSLASTSQVPGWELIGWIMKQKKTDMFKVKYIKTATAQHLKFEFISQKVFFEHQSQKNQTRWQTELSYRRRRGRGLAGVLDFALMIRLKKHHDVRTNMFSYFLLGCFLLLFMFKIELVLSWTCVQNGCFRCIFWPSGRAVSQLLKRHHFSG